MEHAKETEREQSNTNFLSKKYDESEPLKVQQCSMWPIVDICNIFWRVRASRAYEI